MQEEVKEEILEHNVEIERELEFSSSYRWQHWVRALSIVILTITGFYLAVPFIAPTPSAQPDNFLYSLYRSWHIIFGFVLTWVILYKSYMFIKGREHQMERDAIKDIFNIKIWIEQIGYISL